MSAAAPRAVLIGTALIMAACGASAPSAETIAAERAAVAADRATTTGSPAAPAPAASPSTAAPSAAAPAQPAQIDPPASRGASRIVSREDARNPNGPVCIITVAYAGAVEQEVAWRSQCADASISLIAVATLQSIGQLDDLAPEAASDIRNSPGGRVLYIEEGSTSSAFPLNVAGRVYEVVLAD